MTLDVRLTLRTHDQALVHMTYGGRWVVPAALRNDLTDPVKRYQIDPSAYYFRTNPLFETGAPEYAWLNDVVSVGSGYLVEGGIAYKVTEISRAHGFGHVQDKKVRTRGGVGASR